MPQLDGVLYQENKILKITDFLNCKNILFIRNSLRKENLPIFNKMFTMLIAMSTSAPILLADFPHAIAADHPEDVQIYVLERP